MIGKLWKFGKRKEPLSEEEKKAIVEGVIKKIEEELAKKNLELEDYEREKLEDILLNDIPEAFEKKNTERILFESVSVLVGVLMSNPFMVKQAYNSTLGKAAKLPVIGKKIKEYDPSEAVQIAMKLPYSFAEKWSQTEAYDKFWLYLTKIMKKGFRKLSE